MPRENLRKTLTKKLTKDPDDTIMKQLLSLLVYTNYCRNTTVQSDYELFSKDMHDFFVCNDNFSEQLISFIAEHKPNCIAHTFSLESKTDSYTDLLRQVFPEYDFWHKDNLALQQSSPFSSEYSEEEIILSTLQPDDLVIIRNAISDKCMRIYSRPIVTSYMRFLPVTQSLKILRKYQVNS